MRKLIPIVLAILSFSAVAMADDTSDGCGLGWQVTNKTTMSATTTRGTTNAFIPPTFGMTTGTIGCARHDIAKRDEAAAAYAVNNYDSLTTEMAEGHGEVLAGFARTLGCNDASMESFSQMTQKNYKSLVSTGEQPALNMFDQVKTHIKQDAVLSASCGV